MNKSPEMLEKFIIMGFFFIYIGPTIYLNIIVPIKQVQVQNRNPYDYGYVEKECMFRQGSIAIHVIMGGWKRNRHFGIT